MSEKKSGRVRIAPARLATLARLSVIPVLALAALVAWGVSSPVGSSPDDDFHLASIWCAGGDRTNICEPGDEEDERTVDKDLVTATCFAGDPSRSADCQGADFGQDSGTDVITSRGNFEGLYPPVYYFVAGAFASSDLEASVLSIRIFNSLLFVSAVAVLAFLLPAHRRRTLLWSLTATLVPLGMFIVPSINPSGWAVLSAGTLLLAILGFFESTGWRRVALGAFAAVAALIGAGARADSAVYVGVAVVASLIITFRPTRAFLAKSGLLVGLGIIAVLFYFSAQQSADVSSGLSLSSGGDSDWKALALFNLQMVPDLWAGVFGRWGLGWLDTAMPAYVWVSGLLIFGGVVFIGAGLPLKRKPLALGFIVAVLFLVPTVVLTRSHAVVGDFVQPRYILPLIVMVATVALLHASEAKLSLSLVQRIALVAGLGAANALALHTNFRRYITGTDAGGINLDNGVEWWWPTSVSPMAVWIVGSAAFIAFVWFTLRATIPPADSTVSDSAARDHASR